jgi:hypothetical protein
VDRSKFKGEKMATVEDAKLILQLYEMRREDVMRDARAFFTGADFMPSSAQEIMDMVMTDKRKSAWFRQTTSYWDMAAALVNHGTIDASLFFETNGEFLAIWAKIGDFVPELRGMFGPQYLQNLEKLVAAHPNGAMRIGMLKERFKKMAAIKAEQADEIPF